MDLEPSQKLLFVYLFSNKNASLCGLYKLPAKVMAFETGLELKYLTDTLSIFSQAGKAHYENGIVWVVNMMRYHDSKSPKVKANRLKDISLIPDCPIKRAYLRYIDTVSIQYPYPTAIKEEERKEEDRILDDTVSERCDDDPPSQSKTIQELAEWLIGVPAIPDDTKTLNDWEKQGVTEGDIRAALKWRTDNKHPPVKTISQLAGGVKTSRLQRLQNQNGRGNSPPDWIPEDHATEVW